MKGICFTEPLFHATIEGRKTMTRRIMNPQPDFIDEGKLYCETDFRIKAKSHVNEDGDHFFEIRPRYKVGDIVYLKEPYHVFDGENKLCLYRFSPKEEWLTDEEHASIVESVESLKGWKNKLSMPAWAARYFIKITAVRAERLQEISDRDCFREGIIQDFSDDGSTALDRYFAFNGEYMRSGTTYLGNTPRSAFAALIDKINGKGTWESNPWVFVYEYELHSKE